MSEEVISINTMPKKRYFERTFLLGTLCAILGAAIFPMSMISAAMLPNCSPLMILTLQALWCYCSGMSVVAHHYSLKDLWVPGEKQYVVLRALSLGVTSITSYMAIVYIPTGDVFALRFSNSIFVSVCGYFFLKESLSRTQFVCVLGVVVGVFFVTKPSFVFGDNVMGKDTSNAWIGISLAIVSCAFQTVETLMMRKTPRTPAPFMMASSRLALSVGSTGLLISNSNYNYPNCNEQLVIVAVGIVCIMLSSLLFDYASKLIKAGNLALLRTASVFFSYCYQVCFLGLTPYWTSILGATIICFFVVLSTLSKESVIITKKLYRIHRAKRQEKV